ncbi:hypothetical protein [Nocardia vulneris]|uniref:Secreted protein n=1 Tax=Nocardia vulneris TaxID=1141657 RepID=A0ABR4Z5K6_9NOCA|nr:hypothetical protein [Nocardia vulneris]KIA60434.1 hypothetical protein FG87_37055 [Nocardia vulneris]
MGNTRNRVTAGLVTGVASIALIVGNTGTAAASPVVHQSLGSCTWSADVVQLEGVPVDGYAGSWYIKTGRTDNSKINCSFEVQAQFKMKSGSIETVQFGSSKHAHDQAFAKGPARVWQVALKLCADGKGCTGWNTVKSSWNR